MGSDNIEEIESLKCSSCGGDLAKGTRTQYDEEDEEDITVPVGRCIQCNREYDQHTTEYYALFADDFTYDKDTTLFKLGLKGKIKGIEYEVIGRLRYQEEDEYDKATWDEWVAVSADGVFHYFVEEDGEIYSYEEYIPQSIDMESSDTYIEFEGKKIKKEEGYTGRIVLAEGELSWKPEIGEPVLCYDLKKGGAHYTIEKSEDEVSITRGEKLSHGQIIDAFNIESLKKVYGNTIKKREEFRWKGRIYIAAMILTLVMWLYSCFSDTPVPGVMNSKNILVNNIQSQDAEGMAYESQLLFGPFEIPEGNSLYDVKVWVDEKIQPLHLEWQSFRFMLISENRLNEAAGGKLDDPSVMKEVFEDIDALPEPLESYVVIGDFWDEEGRDSDGYWHESDMSYSTDFILDDAGKYYVYMEVFNNHVKDINAVAFSISKVKSYRYYVILFFIFFILWGITKTRSKTYNELPFEMSDR
jgi:hypothetical protein